MWNQDTVTNREQNGWIQVQPQYHKTRKYLFDYLLITDQYIDSLNEFSQ